MAILLDAGHFTLKPDSVERLPLRACVFVRYTYWELANRCCSQCIHRRPNDCIAHMLDVVTTAAEPARKIEQALGGVDELLAALEQYALVRTVADLRQFPELRLALNTRRPDSRVPSTMRSRSDLLSLCNASQSQLASLAI
jgi:hypothetical protein